MLKISGGRREHEQNVKSSNHSLFLEVKLIYLLKESSTLLFCVLLDYVLILVCSRKILVVHESQSKYFPFLCVSKPVRKYNISKGTESCTNRSHQVFKNTNETC